MATSLDPSTTKYLIKAKIKAEGVVEKPDVVGAIFGQTEGLIGDDLDLRDLQKTGRMGRMGFRTCRSRAGRKAPAGPGSSLSGSGVP